jgi:predicted HicB family RNase H-like nuclease
MIQEIAQQTMEYRDYTAWVEWIEEEGLYSGEVLDTWGTIGFRGNTLEEACQAFRKILDWYLDECFPEERVRPRVSSRPA